MQQTGGVQRRLYDAVNLRKGEERIVILLLVFSFFQFFSVALFFVTASAIFLADHPITSLPYVYIYTGITIILLGALFSLLEKKISAKKLLLGETVLILLVILLFRSGFISDKTSYLGFGLIVWHRVMADVVGDGFDRLALLLFDVRQGKRLFGLISSAEIPANIIGYSAASVLVPLIGVQNLLLVSAFGLGISIIFLSLIVSDRRELVEQEKIEDDRPEDKFEALTRGEQTWLQKFFQSRFIFSLSLTVFFSVVAFTFIEFAFLSRVDASYTNQQEIVLFISVIFGIGQIIAFFIKTFLYGYIQRRYGIKVSLFVLPVILAFISLATLIEGLFSNSAFLLVWTWVAIMLLSETMRSSLYQTTLISLLQPLSKKMKLDGFNILGNVESIAIGLSGLLLLVFFSFNSVGLLHYSIMLLFAVGGWIVIIPNLNKNYLVTLEEVLKKRIIEGGVLSLNNPQTLKVVNDKLHSDHPGEVLYAMDVLCKEKDLPHGQILSALMNHPLPEVRKEVYSRIEQLRIIDLQPVVRARITDEPLPEIRKLAIHAYCALGESNVVNEIIPLLDHENKDIKTGALVGLICFGGINGIIIAGQRLMEFVNSTDASTRSFAAEVIGEVGIRNFYHPLLVLLRDDQMEVEKEALKAAGKIRHPRLFPPMLKAVSSPNVFEVAMNSLIKSGEEIMDVIEPELTNRENTSAHLRRLIYVCGRVGGERSVNILKTKLYFRNIEVRNQVVQSCAMAGYKPSHRDKEVLIKTIHLELADATYFLNFIEVLTLTTKWLQRSNLQLLMRALRIELNYIKKRLLFLLGFLYQSREIIQLWNNLQMKNKEKAANALEILDVLASKDITAVVLPLLEDYPVPQQLKILNAKYPAKKSSVDEYLYRTIAGEDGPTVLPWTQSVACYLVNQVKVFYLAEALRTAEKNVNPLVSETASWTMRNLESESPEVLPMVNHDSGLEKTPPLIKSNLMSPKLLTIEKVMALKTTGLFRETAEDLLVDIAFILKENAFKKNEVIVQKNEVGTCMFIIYSGSVKVHDGEHTLAELRSRDFFGELSLLDAEPRSASVTALEDSLLLRIDQHAFYEIMADRMEVIREIMKILCSRLRHQNQEVARLSDALNTATNAVTNSNTATNGAVPVSAPATADPE
jgi:ATP:ADP antiporter, AAA family